MNTTAPSIICRSASSWEVLEYAVEKAAEMADKVWTWAECKEETSVAVFLTVFIGLVVLVAVLT